jgi:hypothetical protein
MPKLTNNPSSLHCTNSTSMLKLTSNNSKLSRNCSKLNHSSHTKRSHSRLGGIHFMAGLKTATMKSLREKPNILLTRTHIRRLIRSSSSTSSNNKRHRHLPVRPRRSSRAPANRQQQPTIRKRSLENPRSSMSSSNANPHLQPATRTHRSRHNSHGPSQKVQTTHASSSHNQRLNSRQHNQPDKPTRPKPVSQTKLPALGLKIALSHSRSSRTSPTETNPHPIRPELN